MTDRIDHVTQCAGAEAKPTQVASRLASEFFNESRALPASLHEYLLSPVGVPGIVTVAAGTFAHLAYRLKLAGVGNSLDQAARINSKHVLELARSVGHCSADALLRIGALIAARPIGMATVSGTAFLVSLHTLRRSLETQNRLT